MREALFVLAVIAVILGLTAFRYRKQLAAGLQIWRMLKEARKQAAASIGKPAPEPEMKASGPLVRCSKCGTWTPSAAAISLGKQIYFCSKDCVERV